MDLKNILKEIGNADQSVFDQQSDRRQALKSFGSKAAIAALPLAIGSLFQKAQAKTTTADTLTQVLNFALQMEYMAYNFYHTANNTGGLIAAGDKAGFLTVEAHKKAHILYLNAQVAAQGGQAYTPKNYDATASNPLYIVSGAYDFTAGGKYPVFSDYPSFLAISEAFEDTMVRAYKGEIESSLLDNVDYLQAMMRIQSVTARDAAHARFVRRNLGYSMAPEHSAPWITNNIPPLVSLQLNYNGEDAVSQQGVDITTLPGHDGNTPFVSATAAFDESLDKTTVLGLFKPFML